MRNMQAQNTETNEGTYPSYDPSTEFDEGYFVATSERAKGQSDFSLPEFAIHFEARAHYRDFAKWANASKLAETYLKVYPSGVIEYRIRLLVPYQIAKASLIRHKTSNLERFNDSFDPLTTFRTFVALVTLFYVLWGLYSLTADYLTGYQSQRPINYEIRDADPSTIG